MASAKKGSGRVRSECAALGKIAGGRVDDGRVEKNVESDDFQ